jgi:ABC-type multidrug transport system fused ATPase/permease subunit
MFSTLFWAVSLLFLTNLSARFFALAADNVCTTVANRIETDLIRSTFAHVLHLPLGFFSRRASGALVKQVDQSDQIAPIITAFSKDIAPEVFRVVGIVTIMFTQNAPLTLVALATLPAYLFVAMRSTRRLESTLPAYYRLWEQVSSRIQDAVTAVKTVKLCGAEQREVARFTSASQQAYAAYLARNRLQNRYAFWQSFLAQLGKALVLGFGGWKVLEHQLTPGDVVMFVAYLDRLYDPIEFLTSLTTTLQQHLASLQRALRLLDTGGAENTGDPVPPGLGKIKFADVYFGYVPKRDVLHGVTLTVESGTVTALVGPSGAGKTTLVDLILRLYEPRAGTIFLDGQPLASLDPAAVRQVISVVSADGAVFRGTLADNIRYKRPTATDAEVRTAALAAGLGRALDRLSEGLNTEIGEGGVGLSVGERQRLQLARVLVSDPRILILDEATANLDYATEAEVKHALHSMRHGRTTLVIAHRFSMVRDADRVIVLESGRVVDAGTPDELIARGGWFAHFAQSGAGGTTDADAAGNTDHTDPTIEGANTAMGGEMVDDEARE